MMYQSKFVAALKANGKVLREFDDTVYVPYGSEYSILLKNLHSERAVANITIDGQVVVDGGLVLDSNREINLERFVKAHQHDAGNRFKFIERTASVEDHRGVKLDDGIIRIEFQFEKPTMLYRGGFGPVAVRGASYVAQGIVTKDIGITVPGSISNQQFVEVSPFDLAPEKHVIVLRILGENGQSSVTEPVTVAAKPKCVTCGRVNKATSKFCSDCGTSLVIL